MTMMRTAMISPEILGRTNTCNHSFSRSREVVRRARRAPCGGWRQALIEAYPIVGIAMLLAYFAWTLVARTYVAY